jgi:RNA 2',3'-cyclic 3'-phosphodiesterase
VTGRPATAVANRADGVRVFVGLRIAPEIAAELAQRVRGLERAGVRLVAPADIHLTIVPPWNEASIPEAIERLRRVVIKFGGFSLTFQRLGYGPQRSRPRLLWAECKDSDEIAELRAALLQAYGHTDERPFRPHVTVARIRRNGRAIAKEHPIDQDLSLTQRVDSIELFQSPPPGGSGYQVLASSRLGETRHAEPTT